MTPTPQQHEMSYGASSSPSARPSPSNNNDADDDVEFQEDNDDFKASSTPRYARLTAVIFGMLALGAVGLGIFFFMDSNDIVLQKGNKSQHANFQGVVSFVTVEEHSVPDDCWMTIHDKVYDMTEYAPIHPGLSTLITDHCGTDATVMYDFEHSLALLPIVDEYYLGTIEVVAETTPPPTTEAPTKAPTTPLTTPPTGTPTARPTRAPIQPGNTFSPTTPKPTPSPTVATMSPTIGPTTVGCQMEGYTLADVSQHPDADSCWYVLYGVVYDFTTYIDDHKGGRGTILLECGTDATVKYELEKKHDVALLIKKGFAQFIIGRLAPTTGPVRVDCDDVELVAVTTVI